MSPRRNAMPKKLKLATVWLDGCSGCHMSLLDIDERLLDLLAHVDLVYSPLVDPKPFPEDVDIALVEGAVSSDEDLHKIRMVRERSKTLVALGDCAVTSNVPGMRNPILVRDVLLRAYEENVDGPVTNNMPGMGNRILARRVLPRAHEENGGGPRRGEIPSEQLPRLLPYVRPVHEIVAVDVFLPGCPPPADAIFAMLSALVEGRTPDAAGLSRFGK